MSMFMGVDVGDLNIQLLQPTDLRRRLGLDICLADASAQQIRDQCA